MANYYIEYTPVTITANETWGNNDGADTPLNMAIYPNQGYYVNASMFTMKGY